MAFGFKLLLFFNQNQDTIKKQENIIDALQAEIEDLKERASINVNLYQKVNICFV